jgi:hypothetical protein
MYLSFFDTLLYHIFREKSSSNIAQTFNGKIVQVAQKCLKRAAAEDRGTTVELKKRALGLTQNPPCREFGYAVGVGATVSEHPFRRNGVVAVVVEPLAVMGGVARDPTL